MTDLFRDPTDSVRQRLYCQCFGGSSSHLVGDVQAAAERRQQGAEQAFGQAQPFYSDLMTKGLPFFNQLVDYGQGTTARAIAPQRAALNRRLAQAGLSPNSPQALQQTSDFNAQAGRGFDDQMRQSLFANEAAKMQGAQGLGQLAQAQDPAQFFDLWNRILGSNSMYAKAGQFAGGVAKGAAGGG